MCGTLFSPPPILIVSSTARSAGFHSAHRTRVFRFHVHQAVHHPTNWLLALSSLVICPPNHLLYRCVRHRWRHRDAAESRVRWRVPGWVAVPVGDAHPSTCAASTVWTSITPDQIVPLLVLTPSRPPIRRSLLGRHILPARFCCWYILPRWYKLRQYKLDIGRRVRCLPRWLILRGWLGKQLSSVYLQ